MWHAIIPSTQLVIIDVLVSIKTQYVSDGEVTKWTKVSTNWRHGDNANDS